MSHWTGTIIAPPGTGTIALLRIQPDVPGVSHLLLTLDLLTLDLLTLNLLTLDLLTPCVLQFLIAVFTRFR